MKKIFFLCIFVIISVLCKDLYAQYPYNDYETSKLREFLLQESAEPGVKNYEQLGLTQMNYIDWWSVPGLDFHNQSFLLIRVRWSDRKLAGNLDLSGFEILKDVFCDFNELTNLDVTGSLSIVNIDCYENNFQTLDFTTNVNLEQLCFRYNNIREIDLSKNKKLSFLCCTGNQLDSLNLSGLNKLSTCYCVENNLTYINLERCDLLRDFLCMDNNLTSLDLSGKSYLKKFSCARNNISDLKVENCDYLSSADCSDNKLKNLDFSGCSQLTYIRCSDNLLESIDIEDCALLEELYCYNNKIAFLKMPESPFLNTVQCKNNNMDFYSLPKIDSESVSFIYYPQNIRYIDADINNVDFSLYYEIEGFVSNYTWNNNLILLKPEIVEDGIFRFEEYLANKQLICRIENKNSSFPKLVLRYDVTVTNNDVANKNPDKGLTSVYASEGFIHIAASSAAEAKVYSLQGALLMTKNVHEGLTNIPFKQGVYVVAVNNGKGYKLVVR